MDLKCFENKHTWSPLYKHGVGHEILDALTHESIVGANRFETASGATLSKKTTAAIGFQGVLRVRNYYNTPKGYVVASSSLYDRLLLFEQND